jgi:hypothetical protein
MHRHFSITKVKKWQKTKITFFVFCRAGSPNAAGAWMRMSGRL